MVNWGYNLIWDWNFLPRHLRSMRPLLNDEEYDNLVKLTAEFETSLAPRLQRYLWLKWIWSDNYVSDWWEEYVYLSSRSPLMINSNFYGLDCICNDEPVFKQVNIYSYSKDFFVYFLIKLYIRIFSFKIVRFYFRHQEQQIWFIYASTFDGFL